MFLLRSFIKPRIINIAIITILFIVFDHRINIIIITVKIFHIFLIINSRLLCPRIDGALINARVEVAQLFHSLESINFFSPNLYSTYFLYMCLCVFMCIYIYLYLYIYLFIK